MREDTVCWLKAQREVNQVFDEVEGYGGYPDLVGAAADLALLSQRVASPLPPVCRATDVESLDLLDGIVREGDLRAHFNPYWQQRRDISFRRLVRLGWVRHDREPLGRLDDERKWWPAAAFTDPFTELIGVSLKLRDWRGGGWQAVRASSYLNSSYLAIPRERVTPACVAFVGQVNVGLLGIKEGGAEVIVEARPRALLDTVGHRTMGERLIAELRLPTFSSRSAGARGAPGRRAWAQDRIAVAARLPA